MNKFFNSKRFNLKFLSHIVDCATTSMYGQKKFICHFVENKQKRDLTDKNVDWKFSKMPKFYKYLFKKIHKV